MHSTEGTLMIFKVVYLRLRTTALQWTVNKCLQSFDVLRKKKLQLDWTP